jgi:hypothetical protein
MSERIIERMYHALVFFKYIYINLTMLYVHQKGLGMISIVDPVHQQWQSLKWTYHCYTGLSKNLNVHSLF